MSEKKIVLITGATRGIGLAILKEMSNHNYVVLGTGTNENSVNILKNELKVNKIEGKAYLLDIKNQESINNLLESIKKDYTNTPDILVNNAGVTNDNLLIRMDDDQWLDTIETNINSLYKISKLFIKPMIKKRNGRIFVFLR